MCVKTVLRLDYQGRAINLSVSLLCFSKEKKKGETQEVCWHHCQQTSLFTKPNLKFYLIFENHVNSMET